MYNAHAHTRTCEREYLLAGLAHYRCIRLVYSSRSNLFPRTQLNGRGKATVE